VTFQQGQRVRIPKGTLVHTMYPGKADYKLSRSQVVTIHHFIGEKIRWPGSGGYWCEVGPEGVEAVEEKT
jgi:hypothetical protein